MKETDYYANTGARTEAWTASPVAPKSGGHHPFEFIEARIRSTPRGGRLLDIGCQTGELIRRVHDCFDSCNGLDLGDYAAEWAAFPTATFGVHDLDAAPLPFPDNHFRVVTCVMVIEHVFDVFGLFKEAARVLQPGGYFMFEVPNIGYFKHIVDLLRGRVPRTGSRLFPFTKLEGWDGQHLHYFTIKDMTFLLEQSGLRLVAKGSRGHYSGFREIWPSLLYSTLVMDAQKKA